MRSLLPRLLSLPSLSVSLYVALVAAGCGQPDAGDRAREALTGAGPAAPEPAFIRCDPSDLGSVRVLLATEGGIALGSIESYGEEFGMVARSYRGRGCGLVPDGRVPAAVTDLLDADDHGNLYVLPRASTAPGLLSTLPPDASSPSGQVVRIDPQGRFSTVVEARRGIWSFGVSPQGGTFWSEACGPTGIFAMGSSPLREVIKPTDISWRSNGAVLTGDETVWFIGDASCQGSASTGCRHPLIRSTPAPSPSSPSSSSSFSGGDVTVAALELAGPVWSTGTRLARCGARPCAVVADTIFVWGDDGSVVYTIRAADLELGPGERIEKVAGNRTALYALLFTTTERRLVYMPLRP